MESAHLGEYIELKSIWVSIAKKLATLVYYYCHRFDLWFCSPFQKYLKKNLGVMVCRGSFLVKKKQRGRLFVGVADHLFVISL